MASSGSTAVATKSSEGTLTDEEATAAERSWAEATTGTSPEGPASATESGAAVARASTSRTEKLESSPVRGSAVPVGDTPAKRARRRKE